MHVAMQNEGIGCPPPSLFFFFHDRRFIPIGLNLILHVSVRTSPWRLSVRPKINVFELEELRNNSVHLIRPLISSR